jgi:hypothetical protein
MSTGPTAKAKMAKDYIGENHRGRVAFALVHRPGALNHMSWSFSFPKTEVLPNGHSVSKWDSITVDPNGLGQFFWGVETDNAVYFIAAGMELMKRRNVRGEAPTIIGPFFEDDPTIPEGMEFAQWIMQAVAAVMPKTDSEKAVDAENRARKAQEQNAALENEIKALRAEKERLEAIQKARQQAKVQ